MESALALDGEIVTGTVDVNRRRGRSQMGLALTHSLGNGEYDAGDCSGSIESSLTMATPWVSLRLTVWGALG